MSCSSSHLCAFTLVTRRPYCPGRPKELCFTTLSLPMETIGMRLSVVKQSFFGPPGQYGRLVTRANYWERNFIIFKGEAVLNLLWLKKIIWVIGVLRRTVVCNWRFDNLCRSHLDHAYYRWPRPRYRPIHRSTIGRLSVDYWPTIVVNMVTWICK